MKLYFSRTKILSGFYHSQVDGSQTTHKKSKNRIITPLKHKSHNNQNRHIYI